MLCAVTVYAQFDSPTPPRLHIPGGVPVGRPGGFRQGRVQGAPGPGPRIRRPGLSRPSFKSVDAQPRPILQSIDEPAKPVTEEPEDELIDINTPTAFAPTFFSTPEPHNDFFESITTTSQPRPPIAFNPAPYPQSTPSVLKPEPIRPTQYRPLIAPQSFAPIRNEAPARPQPARFQPLSIRPQRPTTFRAEPRPQLFEEEEPIQPVRQYTRPQEPANRAPLKASPQKYTQSNPRERKPVAQIIRKYREENEDGSITWGFENDDGSFKEETIGVDCITRGKYGYVDPDGLKREYNYETGIACDKAKEEQEEKGYIDYQENRAVLPNGITLDLSAMGKKSKRPYKPPGK